METKYNVLITFKSGDKIAFDQDAHILGKVYDHLTDFHDFVTLMIFTHSGQGVISVITDLGKSNKSYYFYRSSIEFITITES